MGWNEKGWGGRKKDGVEWKRMGWNVSKSSKLGKNGDEIEKNRVKLKNMGRMEKDGVEWRRIEVRWK